MMGKRKQPKGVKTSKGIKIAVVLEEDLFTKIRTRASKERKLFYEVLSDLAKCGLLDIEELERDEAVNDNEVRASELN